MTVYVKTNTKTIINHLKTVAPNTAEYFDKLSKSVGEDVALVKLAKYLVAHADTTRLS